MFRRITLVIALALAALSPLPAHADGQLAVPKPSWWNDRAVKDIRYGQWLPCNKEQDITDDCIDGVNLFNKDGSTVGKLTYIPLENFDPKTAKQKWQIIKNSEGKNWENYVSFEDRPGLQSLWRLPSSLGLNETASVVYAGVALFGGDNFQVNIRALDESVGSIPEGYIYETILRSKSLSLNSKWVLSNVKNPDVQVKNNRVYVRGIPERSPAPAIDNTQDVCQINTAKATQSFANMAIMVVLRDRGQKTADGANPGDVVLGTNGWYCLSDFRWDNQNKQIVVKVGNAHFDADGNVIEGWMELKVKGNRARQWWDMEPSIAAGNAKVEITYLDGTKKVATAVSQYDKATDWLYVRAYGFTYSQPQLAIKFVKPKSKAQTQSNKPTTITCVNKLLVKKFTGINPKCPDGFVKK